jgi:Uma2 family endonuclease
MLTPQMPKVELGRPATYDDLVAVPDILVAEIVDGELWTSPRPALRHTLAHSRLMRELAPPFDGGRGGPGGWRILFEPELHLGDHVVVPDLAGWRRERMPTVPDSAHATLAPDWVCEVMSPSTETLDRVRKLPIYASHGVVHVWLVSPVVRTLEVLRLETGRWSVLGTHAGNVTVRVEPFEAIAMELGTLWEEGTQGA